MIHLGSTYNCYSRSTVDKSVMTPGTECCVSGHIQPRFVRGIKTRYYCFIANYLISIRVKLDIRPFHFSDKGTRFGVCRTMSG
jgi:hypothetical protein